MSKLLHMNLLKAINSNDIQELNNYLQNIELDKLLENEKVAILTMPDNSGLLPLEKALNKPVTYITMLLNSDLAQGLSINEKFNVLNKKLQGTKTLLEHTISKSHHHLQALLGSKMFGTLDVEKQYSILSQGFSSNKNFLETIASKSAKHIEVVLVSSVFEGLSDDQQVTLLTSRGVHGNIPLIVAANQDSLYFLSAFINSQVFKSLESSKQMQVLKEIDKNGKTVFHHAVLKSSEHLEVLFNSEVIGNLGYKAFSDLLTLKSNNDNTPLLDAIISTHKKSDSRNIIKFLKSKPFANLALEHKKNILFSSVDSPLEFFIFLGKHEKSIDPFFAALGFSLAKDIIREIKEYRKGEELPNLAKLVLYEDYKQITDDRNYSALYYLAAKGFDIGTLKQYQMRGLKLITPEKFNLQILDKHYLFTVDGVKQTVLAITGSARQGKIELGLENALHQKGLNVISINTNSDDSIVEADIYHIVQSHSSSYNITLLVLNLHGGNGKTDVLLDITNNQDKAVYGKQFLTNLLKAMGDEKPVEILLTSCNGQLITNAIHDILPLKSEVVTLGEVTEYGHIHTKIHDMQNIAKVLDLAGSLDVNEIQVEYMLIDYLMSMSAGTASPTYTVIGSDTHMVLNLTSPSDCIHSLSPNKRSKLIDKICYTSDKECTLAVNNVVNQWYKNAQTIDIGSLSYLKDLVSHGKSEELGPILAVKFVYSLYCDKLWDIPQTPMHQSAAIIAYNWTNQQEYYKEILGDREGFCCEEEDNLCFIRSSLSVNEIEYVY